MVRVQSVEPDSYAAEIGLLAGDRLLSINDHEIIDIVDYHLHVEASQLLLGVLREDDELWEFELEKDSHEDLGLTIEHPQPRQCGNQCLFCFVHQLPKGMRRTLYIKDEDYRFSYLYGSYITLTNLTEADLQRIIRDKLSPLYISVHSTDHVLREKLLGAKIPEIFPLLNRLTAAGIELHCQIVLCAGENDGLALEKTIKDLASLYPQVVSLAVVPVGLTKHREMLPKLIKISHQDATATLSVIHRYQEEFLAKHGTRFVFAADEFYLLAQQDIPSFSNYENFHQLENGVGMIVQFRQQAEEVLEEIESFSVEKVTLVTGCLFHDELNKFVKKLSSKAGVTLEVIAIENEFFGSDVTVTGLITGADLLTQLKRLSLGDGLLIPDILLKDQDQFFLDDISIDDIKAELQIPVIAIESSPWGVLDGLELLSAGSVEVIHV